MYEATAAMAQGGGVSTDAVNSSSRSVTFTGTDEQRSVLPAGLGENTAIADSVWLPIRFDGERPVVAWHDEWRVEDFG